MFSNKYCAWFQGRCDTKAGCINSTWTTCEICTSRITYSIVTLIVAKINYARIVKTLKVEINEQEEETFKVQRTAFRYQQNLQPVLRIRS